MSYDLIVIGGGPAGYVGAIRAAQLGKKVVCVEKERAGGTCLNWGCIPTKALIRSAEIFDLLRRSENFGLSAKEISFDYEKIYARSRAISDRMAKGVEFLFQSKGVESISCTAQIVGKGKVKMKFSNGKEQILETKNILLATGAVPRPLPNVPVDGKKIMTSREILEMKQLPKTMIIIGAGAIGVEFAYVMNTFGVKVTLIEMLPQILPLEDAEAAEHLEKSFTKRGIEVLTETKVEKTKVIKNGVSVTLSGKKNKTIEADTMLVAIGLQANFGGALSEEIKIELDRGYAKVNNRYETSMQGVFAAGDIIGAPLLAHVASREAIEAVEGMFIAGKKPQRITVTPACTYCHPQVASIGLTEKKAKEQKINFKVGKFPYRASGRAVTSGETDGFTKLIVGEPHGEILGAHIIGMEATELLAEMALAMTLEATTDEIRQTIHAHPTLTEMIAEASEAAHNQAIHL